MYACLEGHTEIVMLMVNSSKEFDIDPNARDDDGETGFIIARRKGHTKIVSLIVNAPIENTTQ